MSNLPARLPGLRPSAASLLARGRWTGAVLEAAAGLLIVVLAGCATGPATLDVAALIDSAPTTSGAPSVVYAVGNVVPMPPGAVRVARLLDVPWAALPPGADVTIAPGIQAGPIMVNARGTAAQPITVHAAQPARAPVLTSSLDFQNASFVKVSNLVIDGSPWAAVVIRQASDHITIAQSTLRNSAMGVNIVEGAGTGHLIRNNLVTHNATVGIGVDGAPSDPADRSRIVGNTVVGNGHHGMEIRGSNYLIDSNVTALNGQTMPGISGIHIYSRAPGDGTGSGNLIRYNYAYGNIDRSASDGNGIEIDQFCDRNEISFNVVWGNDGAGVIVFDGADNQVFSNTAMGNGLDSGRTHGDLGEIILNSAGPQSDRNHGNQVYNNVVVATRPNVPGLFVDWTVSANRQGNAFGPNLYEHRAGGPLLHWGGQTAVTAARVDELSGSRGATAESPIFANEHAPLRNGLRLARTPSSQGRVIAGRKDMLGASPVRSDSFLGAYFTPQGL